MNYSGLHVPGASDPEAVNFHFEAVPEPAGPSSFKVPDGHLLFSGDFQRSGSDLIISDELHRVVVPHYFNHDKRPLLSSPDGAVLDAKIVDALTGHVDYAQAGGGVAAAKAIGHVVNLTGSASIVRNGVAIVVNTGDVLYQNDVVQTGSNSRLGLVLDDGTTFNLNANARFMLNDLNYEPNGTSNHSLMTLIQGAASFVAGQIAPTGDMEVATPTATIGIRGTAVILDISSTDGTVSISVVDQHDNQLHQVQVFNNQGVVIATVSSNGPGLSLTPAASFNVIAQESNKTPDQVAQEFNIFQQVLNTYNAAKQILPNLPQHTENTDTSPHQTQTAVGSPPLTTETPTTTVFAVDVGNSGSGGTASGSSGAGSVTPTGTSPTPPPTTSTSTVSLVPIPPASPIVITNASGTIIQTNQTISGSIDPSFGGSTVLIFDTYNGVTTKLGSATVGSGGLWSQAVVLSGNGEHSIVAQDGAANSLSAPVVFELDVEPPTFVIDTKGGSTNQAVQTISGTVTSTEAAVGSTVTLYDNGKQIGTAAVGSNGTWSTSITLSGNGSHSIVADDTDAAGNTGSSTPVVFTLDAKVPTVAIGTTGSTSNQATHTISGTVTAGDAEIGATVTLYDNGNKIGTATVGQGGTWSTSVTLSGDGNHSIVAEDTDADGNTGSSSPVVFTLDTVPPTVAISTTGATTNQTTQTISGTVTATEAAQGATVTLFDNGKQIGSATIGSDGHWTTSVTLSGDGSHSIVAQDTDAVGNTGSSTPVKFTLDTEAPTVAISTAGATTNQTVQTISGTVLSTEAAPGSTVTLYDNSTQIGAATVGSGGAWSTNITLSGDGDHSIVAEDTDAAGNTGASTPVVFTLDTKASTVVISTTGTTTTQAMQTISGSVTSTEAAPGSTVTLLDNGFKIGTATINSDGIWSARIVLVGDGSHSIVAEDTDAAGNTGSSSPVVFTLDTAAPTVTISTVGVTTNQATQIIAGTVSSTEAAPGSTVALYDNGTQIGTATVSSGGAWSTSVALSGDGSHSIVAKDTDVVGNTGTSTPVVFTLDTVAPTVTISTSGTTTAQATQTISGTVSSSEAAPGSTVTLFDNGTQIGTATVDSGGAWSTSVTLAGGTNSIVAKDTDAAGNTGTSAPVVSTLDTVAPTVSISTTGATTNQATHTVSGTVTAGEAAVGATVSLYDNGTQIGTATVGSGGAWSTDITLSGDGGHSIVAKDTDAAGNTGSSTPVVFTLDTVAPTVAISTSGTTTNQATQIIAGTVSSTEAAVGATVTLYDNGAQIGTATVGSGGAWSTSITLSGDGSHSIVAKDTDVAGNTGASTPVVFTLDTVAPTVAISTTGATTNQATQTISGTVLSTEAAPGSTVTLYDNGSQIGTATVGSGGTWSTSITLSGDGSHSIVAKDTDAAGNIGEARRSCSRLIR